MVSSADGEVPPAGDPVEEAKEVPSDAVDVGSNPLERTPEAILDAKLRLVLSTAEALSSASVTASAVIVVSESEAIGPPGGAIVCVTASPKVAVTSIVLVDVVMLSWPK